MGCNALLVLVIFMVITILLMATEGAPRDLGNNNDPIQALDENKQYRGGSGGGFGCRGGYGGGFDGVGVYGGPGRGGYGGGWRGGDGSRGPAWGWSPWQCGVRGCCVWTVQWLCAECCPPPHQSGHEANKIDAKTHA
ncbi:hypothetical protein PIB30_097559 [Stylosanthes scabra]|uniref:Glycine-rich protein n=1 Tax=Stylosanthes scabra TaxID=79078 RepID=A0ABU6SWT5_9FABA|nr:hypothetical protein [Stylosanthes scabra]